MYGSRLKLCHRCSSLRFIRASCKSKSDSVQAPNVALKPSDLFQLRKPKPPVQKAVTSPVPEWSLSQENALQALPGLYLKLSKARLTGLVTITALAGLALAPAPLCAGTMVSCGLGTAMMSACANTFNQFLEAPYDSQMKRTQARVLVLGQLSPLHAFGFGASAGLLGFGALWATCNPLTASLGLANVLIYAGLYTPLKRHSIACTWAGALVGAIPPLMGWAAATGELSLGAGVLGAILFAWQFPHFNALSWNLRADYSKAGYRVMCVTEPGLCKRTTVRYSAVLVALCSLAAPLTDLSSWYFAVASLPLNSYLCFLSYKFYTNADSSSSRTLFRYSLIYLPLLMGLLMMCRNRKKVETK